MLYITSPDDLPCWSTVLITLSKMEAFLSSPVVPWVSPPPLDHSFQIFKPARSRERGKNVFTSSLIKDLERDTFQYQNMAMFIQIWEKPCPATFYRSFQANSGKCSPMDIYALDGNYQDWWYINCLIFLLLFSFSKLALEQPKVDVNTWESRVVLEEVANNLKRQCKLSLWHFACD